MRRVIETALIALALVSCDATRRSESAVRATAKSTPASPPATGQKEAEVPNLGPEKSVVPLRVRQANYEIVKLNYDAASQLLKNEVGPHAAIARARLSLYLANCEEARAHLSSSLVQGEKSAQEMVRLSESCFGATAGSVVVKDEKTGVWIRLQDQQDRVLVPMIINVADRARATLERDLGVQLPRPLRIDLVRDLFSLAAVSGLPVDAAETTGTVAVARWGRVTMVSPRAISSGFPWADTLAHEITHLLISRATLEQAPLWLQEGIAKRQERRWRRPQLFDDALDHDKRAYEAQLLGRSIGVDQIGPSIAMLPSAQDAATAFSEVTSFMEFWIGKNGPYALSLLLRDIEVAGDADSAMRSVSGFTVGEWELIWRDHMKLHFEAQEGPDDEDEESEDGLGPRALARGLRLVELLTLDGFPEVAEFFGAVDLDRAPHVAALRFLTARAAMLKDQGDESLYLGETGDVRQVHAGWLALYAAQQEQTATDFDPAPLFEQARGLDPLLPEVACRGIPWVGERTTSQVDTDIDSAANQELCLAARKLPVRGSM